MAAKKTRKKRTRKGGQTKAAFIRERAGKSAAEILADAKAAGIKMSMAQIYSQRSQDKRKAGGGAPLRASKRGRRSAAGGGAEQQLRLAIAQIGLDRARAVFDEVESAFLGR